MTKIELEYLYKDKPLAGDTAPSDYDTFTIEVCGSKLYGQIMWPDGSFKKRPCVLLLHGFPGVARNDDIAHTLARIGCVVLTPHHRGAWSSEGTYSFSNCVEDTVQIAEHLHSKEFCDKYDVDPDAIFVIGHSMGGNSAVQACRRLPWLRGLILMAPFDTTRDLIDGKPEKLKELIACYAPLNVGSEERLFDDVVTHFEDWRYENSVRELSKLDILLIPALRDAVVVKEMYTPLWEQLCATADGSVRQRVDIDTTHGFLGNRCELIETIAHFIDSQLCK